MRSLASTRVPNVRRLAQWALVAVVYYLGHRLGYLMRVPPDDLSAIWPATGIALGVLLTSSSRNRAPAAIALAVGNVASHLANGSSLAVALAFLLANIVETGLALWLFAAFAPGRHPLRSVNGVLTLIAAATIANAASALAGGLVVTRVFGHPFADAYIGWWVGDGLSTMLMTPLVLVVASGDICAWRQRWSRTTETMLFLIAWSAAALAVFHVGSVFVALPYAMLALLAWASLRLDPVIVAMAVCILASVASTSQLVGYGPSPLGGDDGRSRMLLMQAYLAVTASMGLLLSASRQDTSRAIARAREGQEQIRSLADHLPLGVMFQLTMDYGRARFVYVSAGMQRIAGISYVEALADAERFFSLVPDEDRAKLVMLHPGQDADVPGHAHRADVRLRPLSGSERYVTVSYSSRTIDDGQVVWDGIIVDVTEQRAAQDALAASEAHVQRAHQMELVGQLAGGVAHDFNNLLTVIITEADRLVHAAPGVIRESGQRIAHAAERAAQLTHQLLAVGRRLIMSPDVFDMRAVVTRTEQLLRTTVGESIAVRHALVDSRLLVKADQSQIERVLLNLGLNARDAMPTGGTLTITAGVVAPHDSWFEPRGVPAGRYVFLSVSDTGTGMSADVRARIFEPFFTTKPVGSGTGLGLPAVDGIVRQSGGFIDVASEPGHGSTFTVYFPAQPDDALPAPAPESCATPVRGHESVLLVEDNDSVRDVTERLLKQQGYRVFAAASGDEAIALAASQPDLAMLVTDVVMPGMSGPEVAERLQAMHPGIKTLFVSGYSDDSVLSHGVAAGHANFLQKPFMPSVLAVKVRGILDGTRSAAA